MSYKKLSPARKASIGANANAYARDNYKQIALKLKPAIATAFDDLCEQEELSRPEMLEKLINSYKK